MPHTAKPTKQDVNPLFEELLESYDNVPVNDPEDDE